MPTTAEAIVFPREGEVAIRTIHLPELGPEDILVRTLYTGISVGTERWYLTNQYRDNQVRSLYPVLPGYLRCGVVEQVGTEVADDLRPGTIVYLGLRATRLDPADELGTYAGCHTSFAVCHQCDAFPVAEGSVLEEVTMAGLAATPHYGLDLGKVGADDLVIVIGQGMIGQMAAQLCRLRGATVITTDLIDKRVELSQKYSADIAINPSQQSPSEVIATLRQTHPVKLPPHGRRQWKTSYETQRDQMRVEGADVVIDTSGSSRMFAEDVNLLRREGRLILQGYFPETIPVEFHPTHRKASTVIFPCAWDQVAQEQVLDLIGQHKLTIKPLITHVFKPAQAKEAYGLILHSPSEVLGILIDWR